MILIDSEEVYQKFKSEERAILFVHADWSEYSRIGKVMIEFVEKYAVMGERNVAFYYGSFEGELVHLAQDLAELEIPSTAFSGNGSVALFKQGVFSGYIRSLIAQGNTELWKLIEVS